MMLESSQTFWDTHKKESGYRIKRNTCLVIYTAHISYFYPLAPLNMQAVHAMGAGDEPLSHIPVLINNDSERR